MSNVSLIKLDLPEVTEKLVDPINKLIETVSEGVGKFLAPMHRKKNALATAEEINVITRALRENRDFPIAYKSENLSIDTTNLDEFVKRTGSRFVFQELRKQQNIESVTEKTFTLLQDSEMASDQPVDQDWINRFFNSIEDISNEKMQDIWAKILAGEIIKPNTFSLRTLDALKNISSDEAHLFQLLSQFLITSGNDIFIPSDDELLGKYNVNYGQVLKLEECGLISSQPFLSLNFDLDKVPDKAAKAYNTQTLLLIKAGNTESRVVSINVYLLSTVGKELYKISTPAYNNQYLVDYGVSLRKQFHSQTITAHVIKAIIGDRIEYDRQDILPPKE